MMDVLLYRVAGGKSIINEVALQFMQADACYAPMSKICSNNPCFSHSEEETEALGSALAETLCGGAQIALHGDLGAGKTVFTRGLARGLGIQDPVTSPTFTIVQEYIGDTLRLYHIDLYRLHGVHDALAFGIEDFLEDDSAVIAIEWSERIEELLEAERLIHVHIMHHPDGRELRISKGCMISS